MQASKTEALMAQQELVKMPIDDFKRLIANLDDAFANGHGAIFYDSDLAGTSIDLFAGAGTQFTEAEWTIVQDQRQILDQLLVFAFEDAPDYVVAGWAESDEEDVDDDNDDADLGADLVERVRLMVKGLPHIQSEWVARRHAVTNVIGDFNLRVIFEPETRRSTGLLRVDSFRPTGIRMSPLASTRSHFEVSVTKSDLHRIRAKIDIALEALGSMGVVDAADVDDEGIADDA
jgi:hypothetical protein